MQNPIKIIKDRIVEWAVLTVLSRIKQVFLLSPTNCFNIMVSIMAIVKRTDHPWKQDAKWPVVNKDLSVDCYSCICALTGVKDQRTRR